jgi:uncharacterized protein involved in exopolysaccharide biosynthesis
VYADGLSSDSPRPTASGPERDGTGALDIVALALRRWPLILILGLVFAALAYGYSRLATPRFMATAQIFVDPRGLQVLDNELTPRQQDSNAAINFVESQVRIVASQSVLSRVIDSERLTDDPEFSGEGRSGWAAELLRSLGIGRADEAASLQERERNALNALYDRVIVRRPERTFVIEVTVRASDADKAARLANAVAHAYIDSQAAARAETARRATQALTARLDELRERVRVAEERAEDFRRRNGLIGTRTQLVSEQQLTDANTQLAQAQARVAEAEARQQQIAQALRNGPRRRAARSRRLPDHCGPARPAGRGPPAPRRRSDRVRSASSRRAQRPGPGRRSRSRHCGGAWPHRPVGPG